MGVTAPSAPGAPVREPIEDERPEIKPPEYKPSGPRIAEHIECNSPHFAEFRKLYARGSVLEPITNRLLKRLRYSLLYECFDEARFTTRFKMPDGSFRRAIQLLMNRGEGWYVLVLPRSDDTFSKPLFYYKGENLQPQRKINEVAHIAHDHLQAQLASRKVVSIGE